MTIVASFNLRMEIPCPTPTKVHEVMRANFSLRGNCAVAVTVRWSLSEIPPTLIFHAATLLARASSIFRSRAFAGKDALLTWPVLDENERAGRLNLITGAYMAYRNPRAHQEKPRSELLAEFLLLNQLFRLEEEAVDLSKANGSP
jgi:hypothetical protein